MQRNEREIGKEKQGNTSKIDTKGETGETGQKNEGKGKERNTDIWIYDNKKIIEIRQRLAEKGVEERKERWRHINTHIRPRHRNQPTIGN